MSDIQRYSNVGDCRGNIPDDYGNWVSYDDHLATIAALTAERDRLIKIADALLAHCDKEGGECGECGRIVCDHGDPMHFHHDGCPSCWATEQEQDDE